MSTDFRSLFEPDTIAVVGPSASRGGPANVFLRNLQLSGYRGRVFPVHPTASVVEGLPAYKSLSDIPGTIDYAYIAVAAARTPILFEGIKGKVKFAQVVSSGFAESAGGAELQRALVMACHGAGARLLGPNCLGLHSPRGRFTFVSRASLEPGHIGVLCQSGGLSIDVIRRGHNKGIRFSGVVSLGNCADLDGNDLLEFFLADEETHVVGLYLEDARDGRRLFDILRNACARKPIALLKGGRTAAGQRASASHTGSLVQDDRVWIALARQTGTTLVENIDEFIEALLLFQHYQAQSNAPTRRIALFGNGGGAGVLASDAFSRAGFEMPKIADTTAERLKSLGLPAGTSIENPIDVPGGVLRNEDGAIGIRILEAIWDDPNIDAVVMHLNMAAIMNYENPRVVPNLVSAALRLRAKGDRRLQFVLVLRSDGDIDTEVEKQKYRVSANELGVAVFDEFEDAAKALAALAAHEKFCHRRTAYAESRLQARQGTLL